MSKIYSADSVSILDDHNSKGIEKLQADWFVYSYKNDGYEGSGFAIWKKDDKYYYDDLGHCSCYGPTEKIEYGIPYNSIDDIRVISRNYAYSDYSKKVLDFIDKAELADE